MDTEFTKVRLGIVMERMTSVQELESSGNDGKSPESGDDCTPEKLRVVSSLHMTFRVVGSQGSTRSQLEQEGEGNRENFLTIQKKLLMMVNGFPNLHWGLGRWEMGQNQGIYRIWVMPSEFGLLCRARQR